MPEYKPVDQKVENPFSDDTADDVDTIVPSSSSLLPKPNYTSPEDLNTLAESDDEEEDDDYDDPIRYKHKENSTTDKHGNSYNHIDFDNKRYTSKLSFKGNRLVYFTSAFVSLFVSLFGYEQGVCSGILEFDTFNKYFNDPSATTVGVVISILEIGAMLSSLLVASISDRFGRKRTILLGTFIFIIGGLLQTFCVNIYMFGAGRVLSGVGVGILSTIVPSYQCEISPSEDRGKLVCGEFTGNIIGYSLSVWVDYFCFFIQDIGDARTNPHSFMAHLSWRLPLFMQVGLAVVLFCGGFFIVESPRWLLDNDMDQQGFNVLALLYDSDPTITKPKSEFFMIKNSILQERITSPKSERSWKKLFTNHLLRVAIACSAMGFAQLNGINIISYYAPMVFKEAGFNDANAILMTGINSLIYLMSTIAPWFLVDRWGRKPILISGGAAMGICLYMVALIMYLNVSATPSLVALLVIIYNAGFGYSWGPIGFLIPPEAYPLSVRAKGVSLAVSTNWLCNFVVGLLAPILKQDIGWKMYLYPATSCIISIFIVLLFYPETKGVELEDMDKVFTDFYKDTTLVRVSKMRLRKRRMNKNDYNQNFNQPNSFENREGLNEIELEDINDLDYERRQML